MASANLPIGEAQIISLFVQAILYGVYLVSLGAFIRVLMFHGEGKVRVNRWMVASAMLLGILGTLALAFRLRHVLDAFIWYHGPGGADAELKDISYWVNVMSPVTYNLATFIADLILIYRCWIVYSRNWYVVAFPLFVWLGTVASGFGAIVVTATTTAKTNINEKHLAPFVTCFAVLSAFQNLLSTLLIAFRIWSIDRQIARYKPDRRLRQVLRMVIESGAVYTLSLIVFLVVFLCGNNGEYVSSVCTEQLIGIVFNILIIRVHQGRTAETELTTITHPSLSVRDTYLSSQHTNPLGKAQFHSRPGESYSMEPVQVNVKQQVTQDPDEESAYGARTGSVKEEH